jgi:hypothetical protein
MSIKPLRAKHHLVVCLQNTGYEVSLERRKIYQALSDPVAERHKQVCVVDESGEDYLYPARYFRPIELPNSLRRAVLAAD